MRRGLWVLSLLVACQALPSGVPLANTGGVLDDEPARDRRPRAESAVAVESPLVKAGPPSVLRGSAAASAEALPDAGAPPSPAGASDGGIVALTWAGEYYGSDRLVRHFEGDADDVELDDKAHTRVEEPSPGALTISIVNSATGDTICSVRATAHGAEASVDAGQSCFSEEGATASLSQGRATLAGAHLSLDFSGRVVAEADDDGDSIEFQLDYHFDGQRR